MHVVLPPVVDAAFLEMNPQAVLADVRWYLDGRDGHAAYQAGHLPGAVWVDLEGALARHDLPATEGRHPLPSPEAFAEAMGALGIGDGTVVVAYDDTGGLTAGRLVTMLRMLGRDAAVLDGGLAVWTAEGRPVATGPVVPLPPTTFTPAPWPTDRLASAAEAAAHATAGGAVLDARAAERFTGEQALIDPRPGHIPGARNAPWSSVLGADGRLKSPEELRAHYASLGAADGDAIAYCGSGVSACMNVLAMEHAGLTPPRLYVASWSGWSADADRPAELGPASPRPQNLSSASQPPEGTEGDARG
ncbi:MAG: sulfurtransferase [Ilumatobacteraceae bacterium]